MLFEKDGTRYNVTDPAHIDCFKAKGWKEVVEKPKEIAKEVKKEPKKKG